MWMFFKFLLREGDTYQSSIKKFKRLEKEKDKLITSFQKVNKISNLLKKILQIYLSI